MVVPLLLLLALVPAAFQSPETLETTWPDGSPRTRAEGVRGPDGDLVRHGEWAEWHENGEVAVEGEYEHGVRAGRWKAFHPNGERRSRGRYEDGELDGVWKSWHPNGEKHEEGDYELGWRDGEWSAWTPDGELDPVESGRYDSFLRRAPDGALVWRAERKDGVRHGRFTAWWDDGSVKAEGRYHRGSRAGEWRFFHEDGTFDPDFVSGVWQDGERAGPLPPEVAELAAEGAQRPSNEPRGDLAEDPIAAKRVRDALREELARPLAEGETGARVLSRGEVPAVVDWLAGLDPSLAADARLGAELEERFLAPSAGGLAFAWRPDTASESVRHNRAVQRRWRSLWRCAEKDPGFWEIDLALASLWGGPDPAPLARLSLGRMPARECCAGSPLAPRFEERGRRDHEERERDEAIERALAWLRRAQRPDGAWTATEDEGRAGDRPGLSALALLALMAGGSTPAEGPSADAIARGLAFVLRNADPATGMVPRPELDSAYDQAVGTWAVCEALATYESSVLRRASQRMVDAVHRMRNPHAAWRYLFPPDGDNDTSVSSWMLLALEAAERAGLEVDRAARKDVLDYFDSMTDPTTGRVGYDSIGSLSARTVYNEAHPRDVGEALTAAVLLCRIVSGETPETNATLGDHAALVVGTRPLWSAAGHHDLYYCQWASTALWQVGGERWEEWEEDLAAELLPAQVEGGEHDGSWEPLGPWAMYGGRVYSTAMCALSLLAPRRYARVGEPWP